MSVERIVDVTSILKEEYKRVTSELQTEHEREISLEEVDIDSRLKRAKLEGRMIAIVDIARRIGVERAVLPPYIISFDSQPSAQES